MLWATDPAVNWSPYTAKIYNDLLYDYCKYMYYGGGWGTDRAVSWPPYT